MTRKKKPRISERYIYARLDEIEIGLQRFNGRNYLCLAVPGYAKKLAALERYCSKNGIKFDPARIFQSGAGDEGFFVKKSKLEALEKFIREKLKITFTEN